MRNLLLESKAQSTTLISRTPVLPTLVDEKHLPAIPTNPFTGKGDWVPQCAKVELEGGMTAIDIDAVRARAPYSDG